MLEGFLRETNTVRVSKKCMRGCPLYINTTAEVVRCCTDDGCNAKFEPMPGSFNFVLIQLLDKLWNKPLCWFSCRMIMGVKNDYYPSYSSDVIYTAKLCAHLDGQKQK